MVYTETFKAPIVRRMSGPKPVSANDDNSLPKPLFRTTTRYRPSYPDQPFLSAETAQARQLP